MNIFIFNLCKKDCLCTLEDFGHFRTSLYLFSDQSFGHICLESYGHKIQVVFPSYQDAPFIDSHPVNMAFMSTRLSTQQR